jgi:DNA-binding GntR family transcriptional regulator
MTAELIRDRVFKDLRADIMSCALQPGEDVRESELAERYGVSKSPIRDALQKLELEGLVEIAARRGHRVS